MGMLIILESTTENELTFGPDESLITVYGDFLKTIYNTITFRIENLSFVYVL